MAERRITVAVEGPTDAVIVRVVAEHSGLVVVAEHVAAGKGRLDERLRGYNLAAGHSPWLVVRDLDRDAECAAALLPQLLPQPARHMVLRIAVRKIESWLLGDHDGLGEFLGVPRSRLPPEPDRLEDPKRELVALARRGRRGVREDMVPAPGRLVAVGPAYTSRVIEFATTQWSPTRAATRSDSLQRCLRALSVLG